MGQSIHILGANTTSISLVGLRSGTIYKVFLRSLYGHTTSKSLMISISGNGTSTWFCIYMKNVYNVYADKPPDSAFQRNQLIPCLIVRPALLPICRTKRKCIGGLKIRVVIGGIYLLADALFRGSSVYMYIFS